MDQICSRAQQRATLRFGLQRGQGVATKRDAGAASRHVGAAFAFFLLELGFVMASAILSQVGLGGLAWARILGGNVVGVALTLLMLWRRHPLAHRLRDGTAEGEE